MATTEQFIETINQGYSFKGEHIKIGVGMLNGQAVSDATVYLPFKTMNRHGLIAGATGTGKTKTLQMLTECLSDNSIPSLVMDIKGDFSGIAQAGSINNKITERYALLKETYNPTAFPVEFLTLSDEKGVRLRATVSEFGPILLSKILGLNDIQGGLLAILFKYCDDNKLPLLDLKDLIKILQYAGDEGKEELEKNYGKISTTSTGTILRKVIELQQQGADLFFGEKSFEVDDLMRINNEGKGIVNILRVTDMQNRPKLFSTFMLQLLAELYATSPEEGDLDKPKLILFIDEAHLLFQEASSALMQQIETVIKLIRSKGIGIFFCTQNPQDIPASVLAQLGLKVQHALRAFTAADRKVIKTAAENFPETNFYKTDELLTQLGIGEAFVTLLNEKGIPTPLVHTLLCSPRSRMDVLTEVEINNLIAQSKLVNKYNEAVDNYSAYEILTEKLNHAAEREKERIEQEQKQKEQENTNTNKEKKEPGFFDNPTVKQIGRTAASVITRSLLGVLGISSYTKKKRKSLW